MSIHFFKTDDDSHHFAGDEVICIVVTGRSLVMGDKIYISS